jgi:hypothetical protein
MFNYGQCAAMAAWQTLLIQALRILQYSLSTFRLIYRFDPHHSLSLELKSIVDSPKGSRVFVTEEFKTSFSGNLLSWLTVHSQLKNNGA